MSKFDDFHSTCPGTPPPVVDCDFSKVKLKNVKGRVDMTNTAYPKWVNNFVTWDDNREQWIAWDETQAYEIKNGFDSWDAAADAVLEYAKYLERIENYSGCK